LRIEPSVMMPQLMQFFHVNAAGFGMLIALYYYAYTPMQAVVGVMTDYFGPKRILLIAIAICAVGVYLFGMSDKLWIASVGRLLVGLGSSFAFVGVLKLAAMWLPHNRFAIFVGLTTALGMLGAMVGDVELSKMVGRIGWHKMLTMSAMAGAVLLPIFWLFVSERVDRSQIRSGAHQTFKNLLGEFWKMVRNSQMWYAGIIGCIMYLSLSAFAEIWGIPFLSVLDFKADHSAAEFNSLVFLGWLIGSPFNGWLSDRLRSRRTILINNSFLSAVLFSIILFLDIHTGWLLALLLFLFGLVSSGQVLCFVIARESTTLKSTATAIGFMNLLVMLGGMTIQPLVGLLLDVHWVGEVLNDVRIYTPYDYHRALTLIPILLLVSALIGFLLKESYREEQTA